MIQTPWLDGIDIADVYDMGAPNRLFLIHQFTNEWQRLVNHKKRRLGAPMYDDSIKKLLLSIKISHHHQNLPTNMEFSIYGYNNA